MSGYRRSRRSAVWAGALLWLVLSNASVGQDFVNFESPQIHPIDLSPNQDLLAVCNTADNRVLLFDVSDGIPIEIMAIGVGLDPVTARFRTNGELWVVNHISDSVNIIDVPSGNVMETILTGDEPTDVVFAGSPQRAFVACSQINTVQAFDVANLTAPPFNVPIEGEDPRALATNGQEVYAAIFESGNNTTILGGGLDVSLEDSARSVRNVVSDPEGPYLGMNPPPNDIVDLNNDGEITPDEFIGDGFSPDLSPDASPMLPVGLIVKKVPVTMIDEDSGLAFTVFRWHDDNGVDWTNFVSGELAERSSRVPGWDLIDNDVAIINPNALTVRYVTGLMNLNMAIAVKSSGEVTVVGTEATNEIRFEPNVRGRFTRVMFSSFDPEAGFFPFQTGEKIIRDINSHLTYTTSTIPQNERDKSVGDPRGIVWNAAGTRAYVTGRGSNNVVALNSDGARVGAPTLSTGRVDVPEGPTGIALREKNGTSQLFVLNQFDASISVIDPNLMVETANVSFFDPTPDIIKTGRKHLYDTHKTSGLGQIACAACHIDGRMDRLAWDLGDPGGESKTNFDQNRTFGFSDSGFEDFHPMKGPMTTQTLQDIIGKEPHHWRGDRRGIEEFNFAFIGLNGDDTLLTQEEMQEFENFLSTIHFPPNPFRNLDNSLPTDVPLPDQFASGQFDLPRGFPMPNGNAVQGLRLYMGTVDRPVPALDGGFNCVTCHTLPMGNGPDSFLNVNTLEFEPFPVGSLGNHHVAIVSVDQSTNKAIKIPQLRNSYEKVGMSLSTFSSRSGFGALHDGSIDTFTTFLSSEVFETISDQDVSDLTALVLAMSGSGFGNPPQNPAFGLPQEPPSLQESKDAHAAVGQQVTIVSSVDRLGRVNQLFSLAQNSNRLDLVARGRVNGQQRGWVLESAFGKGGSLFQADAEGVMVELSEIRAFATAENPITFTVVPAGSGRRIGIDRDGDKALDFDEIQNGTDPADPTDGGGVIGESALLTTLASPAGAGAIVVTPEGPEYPVGTDISLRAVAEPGWRFDRWSGDLNSLINPSPAFSMDADSVIQANFLQDDPEGIGEECAISISPPNKSFDAAGGSSTVQVLAVGNCDCVVSISENFVSLDSETNDPCSDGRVTLQVTANSGPARSATITIDDAVLVIDQQAGQMLEGAGEGASEGAGEGAPEGEGAGEGASEGEGEGEGAGKESGCAAGPASGSGGRRAGDIAVMLLGGALLVAFGRNRHGRLRNVDFS